MFLYSMGVLYESCGYICEIYLTVAYHVSECTENGGNGYFGQGESIFKTIVMCTSSSIVNIYG
jgi:hypothetical protein